MFGLFKKKSKLEKMREKYQALLEEEYRLSHTDRGAAAAKGAEAAEYLKEIEAEEAKQESKS